MSFSKNLYFFICLSLILLLSVNSFAKDCNAVASARDLYECTLEKHPQSEVVSLKTMEAEAVLDRSSQWANPELSVKSVAGENAGEKVGSTELELSIPISQIWLRSASKDVGKAEKKIVDIEAQEFSLNLKKSVLRDIYRFRQAQDELDLVNQALETFSQIVRQYKGSRARGPEQEISLSLVELATGDYELKKNHLVTEKMDLNSRFKAIWGNSFEIKKELFPQVRDKWPELKASDKIGPSFEIRKAIAEADKTQAEHSLAVSESWPSISAGPVIERTTEGPTQYYSHGFNVSVSLPIFSVNGGSRAVTRTRSLQAKLNSELAAKRSVLDRDTLIVKYRSAVESLKKAPPRDELKKKYQRINSLFKQGRASSGLIIEAHRQIVEFIESQNEHEWLALEALIDIKALSNEDIEDILR